MNRGFRDVLLDNLCAHENALWTVFGLCGVLFLFLLVSLTVVEPGSATYVIVVVDLVSVAVVGALTSTVLRYCQPE
ncbi:hypothetical protein [Haloarchaeobius sp. DFWS5]|uniref:hypothetical protein n=1 Tax=Haloarchaeobius sp. DFWS5 TaxID=3446114 RepID=UPI003EBC8F53